MRTFLPAGLCLGSVLLLPTAALAVDQQYSVTDFDRIQVSGPYEVVLTTGKAASAHASGSRAALDRLSVEVDSGMLRIRSSASAWGNGGGDASGPVKVMVSTQGLRGASVNGSGSLTVDKVKGMRVILSVTGSGRMSASALDADTLLAALAGSGNLQLAGKAHILTLEAHGSGDVDATGLTAGDAQIVADTAGTVRLAATGTAKITSSAPGDVTVTGSAACTVRILGTGHVRCGRNAD